MQHIPLPQNPTFGYRMVPCLTDQEYDGGDFETFPARQGYFDRTALEWKKLFDDPSAEFVAFMQLWQYFGPLSSVFELPATQLFTKVRDNGSRVVDTSYLTIIMNSYVEDTPEGYEVQDGDLISRMDDCTRLLADLTLGGDLLVTTTTDSISLCKFMTMFKFPNPLPPEISDSIRLLEEFLFSVEWNYPSPFTLQEWRELNVHGPRNEITCAAIGCGGGVYGQRMLDSGWCPSLIQDYSKKMRLTDFVYIANLPKHDTLSHEACTTTTCSYACVDASSYQTRHATGCGGCSFIAADIAKMSAILEQGSYPVVDLFGPITSENKLCLSSVGYPGPAAGPSHSSIPYVAISHVWSDGLGNPHGNSIPYCQLSDLRRLVRNVPHPPELAPYSSVWLDTICCPVEDGSEIQTMAITKMKATYENASAVLVLDYSLLTHPVDNLSDLEILWRIACSKWTSRLWTLQEGVLARRIFFQFADGPYDLQSGLARLVTITDPDIHLMMGESIVYQIEQLRIPINSLDQASALKTLTHALSCRSTSVHSDEPLCLANLLRIDSSTIARIPASDRLGRMSAFWELASHIPLQLIFEDRKTLSRPGFQWAPASLLGVQRQGISPLDRVFRTPRTDAVAQRRDGGLSFRLPGFLVCTSGTNEVPASFLFKTITGRWISVTTFDDIPIHRSSPRPLMLICMTGFHEAVLHSTLGLVVEEMGDSVHGRYHTRIIQRGHVRMSWGGRDDLLMGSTMNATMVNDKAVELGSTKWCLQ